MAAYGYLDRGVISGTQGSCLNILEELMKIRNRLKQIDILKNGYRTEPGESDIITAAREGDLELVKKVLERCKYDVDLGKLILRAASSRGQIEIVKFLDDWDECNALEWHFSLAGLISNNQVELMKELLEKRKNTLNLEAYMVPLKKMAKWCKNPEVLEYLEQFEVEYHKRLKKNREKRQKYFSDETLTKTVN